MPSSDSKVEYQLIDETKAGENESKKDKSSIASKKVDKKELDCCEEFIRCWVNIPCPSNLGGELRNEVARNNKYTIDYPVIAYRGDSRSYSIVFEEGFSAYSLKRPVAKLCCDPLICCCVGLGLCAIGCGAGIGAGIAAWAASSTVAVQNGAAIGAGLAGTGSCSAACVNVEGCSLDVICGQTLYCQPHVSSWSALALTLNHLHARPYHTLKVAGTNTAYTYVILMDDGCIRFDEFSNHVIKSRDEGSPTIGNVFDTQEIFPRDLKNQTIAPSQIVAAQKISVFAGEERREIKYAENLIFNNKFAFFNKIKTAVGITNEKLEVPMTFMQLAKVLEEELELKTASPRSQNM